MIFRMHTNSIKIGAYADALQTLTNGKALIDLSGQVEKSKEVDALLEKVHHGQQAGELLMQARRSLQNYDYLDTLQLVNQSRDLYLQLENQIHFPELDEYQSRARSVLDLRESLKNLRLEVEQMGANPNLTSQLLEVGKRMEELG